MSDVKKDYRVLTVVVSDTNINAPTKEVNAILVEIQERFTKLEAAHTEAIVELEDQIAAYRAEGSHNLKRYNAVVDILLRLLNNGDLNPADV